MTIKKCETCSKVYKVYGARRKEGSRFCSIACRSTSNFRLGLLVHCERKLRSKHSVKPPTPPRGSKYIPLTKGLFTLVDEDLYPALKSIEWQASRSPSRSVTEKPKFYAACGGKNRSLMHRYILNAPNNQMVDHINGDTLDNRISNLRLVTARQNSYNSRPRSSLGLKGVTKTPTGRYVARIMVNYKTKNLGTFDTAIEAAKSYNHAAEKFYGSHAWLNPV